jgi:uncharacterized protein (DUF427 family)
MTTKHFANINPLKQMAVVHLGTHLLASSHHALALTEYIRGKPLSPIIYFPINHCAGDLLKASATQTFCPIKGTASYFNIVINHKAYEDAVWYYPEPMEGVCKIKGYLSFSEKLLSIEVGNS